MSFAIFDKGPKKKPFKREKLYLNVQYATEKEARFERAQLLRPYPPNHEWCRRLFVRKLVNGE
jgi:hypothetical protein